MSEDQDTILWSTRKLRGSQDAEFPRLRHLLGRRGIDVGSSLLVEYFQDDSCLCYGVLVTSAGEVFEFDYDWLTPDRSVLARTEGTLRSWEDCTPRWMELPHASSVRRGLELVAAADQ